MLIISVHLAHVFDCWTLVALAVITAGWPVRYRGTATHAAATRYPVTSWQGVTAQLRNPCTPAGLPSSNCGPACWTLNPGSYCSFNSHTNSNSALMKYTLRATGWTHSTKLYRDIEIFIHRILEQLVVAMTYFVYISVSGIYLETWCMSVLRCYWRVHGAIIHPKLRTLYSITVSKIFFHFNHIKI